MRLPISAQKEHPWLVHDLAADFALDEVREFPIRTDANAVGTDLTRSRVATVLLGAIALFGCSSTDSSEGLGQTPPDEPMTTAPLDAGGGRPGTIDAGPGADDADTFDIEYPPGIVPEKAISALTPEEVRTLCQWGFEEVACVDESEFASGVDGCVETTPVVLGSCGLLVEEWVECTLRLECDSSRIETLPECQAMQECLDTWYQMGP